MIDFVARIAKPVIWLLGVSTNVVVRVLGGDPKAGREEVTDEEIRALVGASTTLGDEERQIVEEVFAAGERSLREVMLPRTEVDFLPGDMPAHRAVRELTKAPHSRYPVTGESADDILGFVHVRDLLDPEISTRTLPVSELARPVLSMPDTVPVLRALSDMRRASAHLAIVLDEYGGTAGIVTMEDLMEELVGEITDEYDVVVEERVSSRGDLVIDGLTTLDEFEEKTGLVLPEGPYDTLAGYFMAQLGQLPAVGDVVHAELTPADADSETDEPTRLELRVSELDGRRVAAIVVHRLASDPGRRRSPRECLDPSAGRVRSGEIAFPPLSRFEKMARVSDAATPHKPRVLSLAQPTADSLHLGNFLGALRQWVPLQHRPRGVLRRRRPARADRRGRPRGTGRPAAAQRGPADRRGHRPGSLDRVPAVRRARAHPAELDPGLPDRLRAGAADDPVQGQVRPGRGGEHQRRAVHLSGADGGRHPALPDQLRAGG